MTYGKEWNGDIFTTEKFIKYVEEGYFIDEDGKPISQDKIKD